MRAKSQSGSVSDLNPATLPPAVQPLFCGHALWQIRSGPTARLDSPPAVSSLRRPLRRRLQSHAAFPAGSQFVCLAFAQLTWRESLRDIEACLNSRRPPTLPSGTARPGRTAARWPRPMKVATGAFTPISPRDSLVRPGSFTRRTDLGVELDQTVYALDASTIDLCLSLFPWARFRRARVPSKCTPNWICAAAFPPRSA